MLLAPLSVAAMLVSAPAWAATGVDCIVKTLTPAVVTRIGDNVVLALDAGKPADSAFDEDRDAVIAARNTCRAANNWSNDASDAAMSYMRALAVRDGTERAIVAAGMPLKQLADAYAALPEADRRSMHESKASPAAANAAVAWVNAAHPGVAGRQRTLRLSAMLFSGLSAVEFYPAEFAAL